MLLLAFGELTGAWTQADNELPDKTSIKLQTYKPLKQEGAMATRTETASIEQFSIPNFVSKEFPVLSNTVNI